MRIFNKYIHRIKLLIVFVGTIACFSSCDDDTSEQESQDQGRITLDIPDRFMVREGNKVELELQGSLNNMDFEWRLGDEVISKENRASFTPKGVGEKMLIVNIKNKLGDNQIIKKTIFVANNKKQQVSGYFSNNRMDEVNPYWPEQLTLVTFFSARVGNNGSLIETEGVRRLASVATKTAHEHGIPALLCVVHRDKTDFYNAIKNKDSRKKLAENCVRLVEELKLDGIDVDYEAWDVGVYREAITGLTLFIEELKLKLPKSRLLTAALTSHIITQKQYPPALFNHLDYLNLMTYDDIPKDKMGPHASYSMYVKVVESAIEQYPKNKILPGLPFYGSRYRDGNQSLLLQIMYKTVLEMYPAINAENKNEIEGAYIYYDGKGLIKQKCDYALENKLGGVMIWDITYDTSDQEKSLLTVINSSLGSSF